MDLTNRDTRWCHLLWMARTQVPAGCVGEGAAKAKQPWWAMGRSRSSVSEGPGATTATTLRVPPAGLAYQALQYVGVTPASAYAP